MLAVLIFPESPTAPLLAGIAWYLTISVTMLRKELATILRHKRELLSVSGADALTALVLTLSAGLNVGSVDGLRYGLLAAVIIGAGAAFLVMARPAALQGIMLSPQQVRDATDAELGFYRYYLAVVNPALQDRSAILALLAAALTLPDLPVIETWPRGWGILFTPSMLVFLALWHRYVLREPPKLSTHSRRPFIYVRQGVVGRRPPSTTNRPVDSRNGNVLPYIYVRQGVFSQQPLLKTQLARNRCSWALAAMIFALTTAWRTLTQAGRSNERN